MSSSFSNIWEISPICGCLYRKVSNQVFFWIAKSYISLSFNLHFVLGKRSLMKWKLVLQSQLCSAVQVSGWSSSWKQVSAGMVFVIECWGEKCLRWLNTTVFEVIPGRGSSSAHDCSGGNGFIKKFFGVLLLLLEMYYSFSRFCTSYPMFDVKVPTGNLFSFAHWINQSWAWNRVKTLVTKSSSNDSLYWAANVLHSIFQLTQWIIIGWRKTDCWMKLVFIWSIDRRYTKPSYLTNDFIYKLCISTISSWWMIVCVSYSVAWIQCRTTGRAHVDPTLRSGPLWAVLQVMRNLQMSACSLILCFRASLAGSRGTRWSW